MRNDKLSFKEILTDTQVCILVAKGSLSAA